jgi:hypothetical protein
MADGEDVPAMDEARAADFVADKEFLDEDEQYDYWQ